MKLCIAQVRAVPTVGDPHANGTTLVALLDEVAPRDVDVVVTPECFLDGYAAARDDVTRDNLRDVAVDPDSDACVERVRAWARANSAWVILGCTRRAGDDIFNSALIINRQGNLAGCYDKTHCQTHDAKFNRGASLPVFEGDFGTFGVMICADRRWPETVRTLALQGARVIFNPTYGMHCDLNLAMMRTRSFENEVFIAFTHPEQSLVTGPTGSVITDDRNCDATFSVTTIDLNESDAARESSSAHLHDRRPDLYIN